MGRVRGATALAVSVILAGLLVGLLGFSSTLNPLDAILGRGAIVTVPNLAGRPQPGAKADLAAAGLVPKVRTSYSLTGTRGTVIGQDPPPGSRVREGTVVDVVVSRGINRVAMPDAVGKPLADVRGPLDDAGVKVVVERRADEVVARGVVISQDPGPAVLVTGEDTARFVVSLGPADRPVPDVAGLSLEGASFLLGKAGFVIGTVTPTDDATAVVGSVLGTEPGSGTVAAKGTAVNVAEAAGPPAAAVPNVVGQASDAASSAITQLGLVANVVRSGAGTGPVVAQDPVATTPLRPGSVVTLRVGAGG